jgi:hypothetical protein
MTQTKTVNSVETGSIIEYSFKTLTYRKFQSVMEKLEDSRASKDRAERNRLNDEVADSLLTNATQILEEAANADVLRIIGEAIEFNQGNEADAKKPE